MGQDDTSSLIEEGFKSHYYTVVVDLKPYLFRDEKVKTHRMSGTQQNAGTPGMSRDKVKGQTTQNSQSSETIR
jgi:hypothetical protein